MPKCLKCKNSFPNRIWIDSKIRNLQRRKYCLNCSPFGKRNTIQLHANKGNKYVTYKDGRKRRIIQCNECGKSVAGFCHVCYQKSRELVVENKVYGILGRGCWICGYNKGTQMLDFHHIIPAEKHFCVNKRTMANLAWKRVWNEIQKCLLLCCRCHREVECGIISANETTTLYKERWKEVGSYNG